MKNNPSTNCNQRFKTDKTLTRAISAQRRYQRFYRLYPPDPQDNDLEALPGHYLGTTISHRTNLSIFLIGALSTPEQVKIETPLLTFISAPKSHQSRNGRSVHHLHLLSASDGFSDALAHLTFRLPDVLLVSLVLSLNAHFVTFFFTLHCSLSFAQLVFLGMLSPISLQQKRLSINVNPYDPPSPISPIFDLLVGVLSILLPNFSLTRH